jgi:hypothetical protein
MERVRERNAAIIEKAREKPGQSAKEVQSSNPTRRQKA